MLRKENIEGKVTGTNFQTRGLAAGTIFGLDSLPGITISFPLIVQTINGDKMKIHYLEIRENLPAAFDEKSIWYAESGAISVQRNGEDIFSLSFCPS